MALFIAPVTVEALQQLSVNTLVSHLGIEFLEVSDGYIQAKMPVDHRTHQPLGLLHGGASVALAETLGSIAGTCCIDVNKQYCVGVEINANHVRSVRSGYVIGTTLPIHVGKRLQVWEVRITNQDQELVCISRITLSVLDKKA